MTRIKLIIVDDHAIFRRGVRSLLADEPDIAVVGEAGNAAHVGVHVYASRDLYNWKDEGIALAVSADPKSPITRGCILERPKVIFNPRTRKFVRCTRGTTIWDTGPGLPRCRPTTTTSCPPSPHCGGSTHSFVPSEKCVRSAAATFATTHHPSSSSTVTVSPGTPPRRSPFYGHASAFAR